MPSKHLYGSVLLEFLRIARCRINDFITRPSDLFSRMMTQGGNRTTLTKQLKKVFHCYRYFKNLVRLTHVFQNICSVSKFV